jgi:phage gpG-like protein
MPATRVDMRGADRKFKKAKLAAGDLRPVFRQMKPVLKTDVARHFNNQQGPNGPWPGRSRGQWRKIRGRKGNTYKRGKRAGALNAKGIKKYRAQLGRLRGVYTWRTAKQRMEMHSRVPWSGIHQEGGVAGRGSRIPARTFLWAGPVAMYTYAKLSTEHVAKAFA